MLFIITIKFDTGVEHNPEHKQEGKCPCEENLLCTDKTGEHHSFLIDAIGIEQAKRMIPREYKHITRIEKVYQQRVN